MANLTITLAVAAGQAIAALSNVRAKLAQLPQNLSAVNAAGGSSGQALSALAARARGAGAALAAAAAKGGRWVATNALRALRSAASATARGVKSLGLDLGKLALSGGKWVASKALSLLKNAAIGAVGALAGAASACAVFGAKQEQTRLKLEVMLGSVDKANALLGRLQKFANVTPFNTSEVVSAGQTLLGFGVAAGDVENTLKMIGDVSAGTGKDLNELAAIYGKAMAKGKVETEQLNQLTEAGVPILKQLASQYGVSESAVYEMAQAGKISAADLQQAFAGMTSSGGVFGGMMEKQSKTVGGLWSTLLGNIQTIAATVGEQLAPLMSMVLEYLNGWAAKVGEMAADGTLLEWIGRIATAAVTTLTNIALVVDFSTDGEFSGDPGEKFTRVEMSKSYSKMRLFSGDKWIACPSASLGLAYYGGSIAFTLDTELLPGYKPGTTYYARYCWIDEYGEPADWKGFVFTGDVSDFVPVRTGLTDEPKIKNLTGQAGTIELDYQEAEIFNIELSGNLQITTASVKNLVRGEMMIAHIKTAGHTLTAGTTEYSPSNNSMVVGFVNLGNEISIICAETVN